MDGSAETVGWGYGVKGVLMEAYREVLMVAMGYAL